jgi:hypothetical protein
LTCAFRTEHTSRDFGDPAIGQRASDGHARHIFRPRTKSPLFTFAAGERNAEVMPGNARTAPEDSISARALSVESNDQTAQFSPVSRQRTTERIKRKDRNNGKPEYLGTGSVRGGSVLTGAHRPREPVSRPGTGPGSGASGRGGAVRRPGTPARQTRSQSAVPDTVFGYSRRRDGGPPESRCCERPAGGADFLPSAGVRSSRNALPVLSTARVTGSWRMPNAAAHATT